MLHDGPAAALLVDLATGEVVHGNEAAAALVGPEIELPVATAVWSLAARMVPLDGPEYDDKGSPLVRGGLGDVIHGEPLLVGGRALWATAVPLPGPSYQALVVLFDLDPVEDAEAVVRERAVVAAGLSFTVADPHQPDCPLIYVNPAFERTTGYTSEEVLGRNCRFLQGPATEPVAVRRIRLAIEDEQHLVITLLNYRKDGTAFWNELSLSPLRDRDGTLTHFVGVQADVTARVLAEHERKAHLNAERSARAELERANARLALLAEATAVLSATLDVDEALDRLTGLVVPALADFCTIDLLDTDHGVRRVSSRHVDDDGTVLMKVVEERQPSGINDRAVTSGVLAGGPPVLLREIGDRHLEAAVDDAVLRQAYADLAMRSVMVVPLAVRGRVLGALALFTSVSGRTYDDDDLRTAADLGRRAALVVDNARLYQREHEVAAALQRSMLPELPFVPGVELGKDYLPSHQAAEVGGDWYDVLALPDGTVGVAMGDVMGHDLNAAAAMGQLRSVLRSYAWQGGSPAAVLSNLDNLVQGLGMAQLATALYGRLDVAAGTFTWSNAGHLPPALRRPDGSVQLLRGASSVLVGALPDVVRAEDSVAVPPGSVLVLYTDGLVEGRHRDLDEGLEMLTSALQAAPDDAQGICDALTSSLSTATRADDVAVLVVKVL